MKLPQQPPDWMEVLRKATTEEFDRVIAWAGHGPSPDSKYRHWDTFRRLPGPEHENQLRWAALKMARSTHYREIPLVDANGRPFRYALVDPLLERLHRIDRDASGHLALPEHVTNKETRDRFIVSSLIEEAITSSQLEGAATTRQVAKEMLRSGRRPMTRGEQMILNNFRAIQQIREWTAEPLTPALIEQLHQIITHKTIEGGDTKYRQSGDGIGVYWENDLLLHAPPPADEIETRLLSLCRFANETETGVFLHPVVKAIILHFWLAYDHPFTDGNGRTARALFYWSMLRDGFWLAEFLSISTILRRAPARYAKSFLYTETDDNDLTYFILSQLRVIEMAIDSLVKYLRRKVQEFQEAARLLRSSAALNHRQIALLAHAVRHPGHEYTVESHQTSHATAYDTARKDLLDLQVKGLLSKQKRGKKFVFQAVSDLTGRLHQLT